MFKVLTVLVLTTFLITGCSETATESIDEEDLQFQVSLMEYEKCLDLEREKWVAVFRNTNRDADWLNYLELQLESEERSIFWWHLNDCLKYRPISKVQSQE